MSGDVFRVRIFLSDIFGWRDFGRVVFKGFLCKTMKFLGIQF